MSFYAFLLLTLSCILRPSTALFKDQAGKWDWRQSYIGRAKFIESDATQSGIKRVFVATHDNALAAVNARTGHFFWRHLYEDDDGGNILAILGGAKGFSSGLISISGSVESLFRVRSWNKEKGHLQWELVLPIQDGLRASTKTSRFVKAIFVAGNDYTKQVVIVFEHAMYVLNVDTGALGWTHEFAAAEVPVDAEVVGGGSGEQFVVANGTPRERVSLKTFDSLTGDLDDETELAADWFPSAAATANCVMDPSHILCFDSENGLLRHAVLGKQARFSATPLDLLHPSLTSASISSITPLISSLGVFQLSFSTGQRLVVKVDATSGGVTRVGGGDGGSGAVDAPSTGAVIGETPVLVRIESQSSESYRLKFVDAASGEERRDLEQTIDLGGWRGGVDKIIGVVFSSRKDTALTYRLVVATEDHSLALIVPPGRAAWVREEALASILSVAMLELPVSKMQAQLFQDQNGGEKKDQNVASALISRISMQAEQFISFMYFLQDKFRVRLPPPRDANGNPIRRESSSSSSSSATPTHDLFSPHPPPDMELVRDSFGLRKIIVVSTAARKLIALDSETGFIVWRKFLADIRPFGVPSGDLKKPEKRVSPLYVLRSAAHVPRSPLCLLVGKSASSDEGVLYEFNPLTGEPISNDGVVSLGYKIKQVSLLDASFPRTSDHVRGAIILDDALSVHVHPPSLTQKIVDRVSSHFVFAADASKGKIEGFAIHPGNNLEWKATRVWNVKIPEKLGSITAVVGRPPGEQTHSQGRVLADRSVMYKYLNPNLVAIVAEGEDDSVSCEGTSTFQCFKGQVSIFLLDVITGHLVFTTTHKKSTGPVNIVHSENWLVYSYWNQRYRRNEIASIELYEGKTQSNTTSFSSLDLPLVSPMVERQAFIFPSNIQALGVSLTEKGISNKDLLISLASGGLLELPRMFLDPRRPVEPRPEDREEGLIPYTPELPIPPIGIVSYNQTISRARGIATSPAGLESTSLVLVHGMDLFFTRIHPSKMFDVLKDDFDYFFISSVLFGLIAASFVFQQLAVNKSIKRAWK